MAADADEPQPCRGCDLARGIERVRVRDAELVGRESRGDIGMGARVDVRVDAQRHRRDLAHRARDGVQPLDLGIALDVEAADAGGERGAHLRFRLADAGEDDAVGPSARREHARELAAGDDVEARAQARQHVEHREVRVRLYGVADRVLHALQSLVERAERFLDEGARIHVAGSAEARRDGGERNAVEGESARDARETAHARASEAGFAGSGSLSGPFWPHAASATTTAAARRARIIRAL